MTPKLTPRQKKYLKGLAHHLDPVVSVGKGGVSTELIKSVEQCLKAKELIKVRVLTDDRDVCADSLASISQQVNAQLIQSIGHIGVMYRANPKRKIELPAQFGIRHT
jgi:RNA-binding protein